MFSYMTDDLGKPVTLYGAAVLRQARRGDGAAINVSIGVDRRLAGEDLAGSRAHAAMLAATGIISAADEQSIQRGLDMIAVEIFAACTFPFRDEFEDIHMNIEARLAELIGPAA